MFELMDDLKGMGENNASWIRKLHLHRETMFAAASIYKGRKTISSPKILLWFIGNMLEHNNAELYGNEDGSIPATFQIIYMIGWKPDPSQPKPLDRGTGEVSIKDLYRLDEIIQQTGKDDEKKR